MTIIPAREYERTDIVVPRKPSEGLDALVDTACGWFRRRPTLQTRLRREAELIDSRADSVRKLSDARLREELGECRDLFRRRGRDAEDHLHRALAAIREAADRTLGLRPYPVQLMGALALHRGMLAEMATGEGKTLVACMAAVIAGWSRKPCHVITVNDYLAQRDATWGRPLYHLCGLTSGHVIGELDPPDRKAGYDCDITYTTSKEVVADFLRDRIRLGELQDARRRHIVDLLNPSNRIAAQLVMRGIHTAIVDEADSVLIDEAVTPLIISTRQEDATMREAAVSARRIAEGLVEGRHYHNRPRYKEVELTETGRESIRSQAASLPGLWRSRRHSVELVHQALVAREFFLRGKQYVVQDGKVMIVDEFTGRIMPQRTWRAGLHQAIEAKEGVEVTEPTETLSRLSFQRFFRFYRKLSGMTGTAREAAGELWHIYRLPFVRIPTNRPCIRTIPPDRVFVAERDKWQAVLGEIERRHATGQPILVGTRSVEASETLAALLRERELEFNLLNAVHHAEEAAIVAQAGLPGKITIATNMAGRGTDIRLGHGVEDLGGLCVLATERHESGRIDRQLFGRCARQGAPGTAAAFIALDDELYRRFAPTEAARRTVAALVRGRLPGHRAAVRGLTRLVQSVAQRQAYRQRRNVLKMDTWLQESLSFAHGSDQFPTTGQ